MRYNRPEILDESGRILRLAWPIVLTSLNWTCMHLIDVAVVGHASTFQLGALAAARTLTFITIVMGIAGLSGILVHSARSEGAGRIADTGPILHAGILLGLGFGLLCLGVLACFALPLMRLIGVAEGLAEPGAKVVGAMALAYPSQFVLAACAYFLEGISRPRRVMAVNLAMLPVNAVLAWAWVGGHFGFPASGAVGAALATSTVSAGGALAILAGCWTVPQAEERGVRNLSAAARRRVAGWLPPLAWFGSVPAIAAALELAGFSWLIALSTQLGVVTAAAFQAMFSLHNLVFSLAIGFGSAAGVRVGNAVGAGEPEEAWPRALIACGIAALVMGLIAILFAACAGLIVRPFSDDPRVLAMAASMLALIAPFLLFDGVQYVLSYALRSLGEQVWAGINAILAFFLATGLLGWLLVTHGWGAAGLVYAAGLGMVSAAALQFLRLWLVVRRPSRSRR
jgi:MATE family multidrug resistance protein